MNIYKYTLPGTNGWIFQIGDGRPVISNGAGTGFLFTDDMSADVIVEKTKEILRFGPLRGDEAAIDKVAQVMRNIDWKATEIKPLPELVAVLINEPPAPVTKNNISNELIDELSDHLKAVFFPLQKIRGN